MSEAEQHAGGLNGALGFVKKHPVLVAGGVFAVGAVVVVAMTSGGAAAAPAATSTAGSGSGGYMQAQLQSEAIQAQQSAATQQATLAANAATSQINGQVSVAQLQAQQQIDENNSNNSTAQAIAALQAALGTTQSNNSTSVSLAGISAQTQQTQIAATAATKQTKIASSAALGQAAINANEATTLGAQQTSVMQSVLGDVFGSQTSALESQVASLTSSNQAQASQISSMQSTAQTGAGEPACKQPLQPGRFPARQPDVRRPNGKIPIKHFAADAAQHWAETILGIGLLIALGWIVTKTIGDQQQQPSAQAVSDQAAPITAAQYGMNYFWPGQYGAANANSGSIASTTVTAPGVGLNASEGMTSSPITIAVSPVQNPTATATGSTGTGPGWTYGSTGGASSAGLASAG